MNWQKATLIKKRQSAEDVWVLTVKPEKWEPFDPGQFYQLQLPGIFLDRCYSILSTPADEGILEFGIQCIPGGVLSPQLCEMEVGGSIEIIGPQGAYFNWKPEMRGPLVLIGGGSGMVPLISIYNHVKSLDPGLPITFIMSAKSPEKIMDYNSWKDRLITRFTSSEPRIDQDFLQNKIDLAQKDAMYFICGSGRFTYDIKNYLENLGVEKIQIQSEQFF